MPLINGERELDLSLSEERILSPILITPKIAGNPNARPHVPDREARQTTGATFQITNSKLYVPVVTLSINDNIKFSENINQRFIKTISWNRYRSEITTQPKNNNLDYLIDPTFRKINRLFLLLFKNGSNDPTRDSIDEYYMLLVEIKDFNLLIDNKPFFSSASKKQTRSV